MLFAPCQHDYSNTGDMISPPKIEKAASGLVWMDLTDLVFMSVFLRCMASVCVSITQQVITVRDVIVSIMTGHGDLQVV